MFRIGYKFSFLVFIFCGLLGIVDLSLAGSSDEESSSTEGKSVKKKKSASHKKKKRRNIPSKNEEPDTTINGKLPSEILAFTFTFFDAYEQATLLPNVCRFWRAIVNDEKLPHLNTFGKFMRTNDPGSFENREGTLLFWLKRGKMAYLTYDVSAFRDLIPYFIKAMEMPADFQTTLPIVAQDPLAFALLTPALKDVVNNSDGQITLRKMRKEKEHELGLSNDNQNRIRDLIQSPSYHPNLKTYLATLALIKSSEEDEQEEKVTHLSPNFHQATIPWEKSKKKNQRNFMRFYHQPVWAGYFEDSDIWDSYGDIYTSLCHAFSWSSKKIDLTPIERFFEVYSFKFPNSENQYPLKHALVSLYEGNDEEKKGLLMLERSPPKNLSEKIHLAEAYDENFQHAEALVILETLLTLAQESLPKSYVVYQHSTTLLSTPYDPERYQRSEELLDEVLETLGKKEKIDIVLNEEDGGGYFTLKRSKIYFLKACFGLYASHLNENEILKNLNKAKASDFSLLLRALTHTQFSSLSQKLQVTIRNLLNLNKLKQLSKALQKDPELRDHVKQQLLPFDLVFKEILKNDPKALKLYTKLTDLLESKEENKKEKRKEKKKEKKELPSLKKGTVKCIVS